MAMGARGAVSGLGWLAVVVLAPGLAGCTSPIGLAAAGADVVTLNATKKTIGDHIVSAATGRDCSIISFETTGDYCPDKVVVDRSRLYCYRTLADVQCHHIPDPYRNGNTALASPPPDIRPVPHQRSWFDDATPYTADNGS
ncbi:hypothetical protein VY88_04540 [Azospirillum thiophilum]|uniref:Lipoprotein n=2 Tax=Azospirillum thiophilum TaxID=528244 RepID=A0AAC8VX16_9PROT|nr:hypothetical protein AL072_08165 [Azospirillum thiophilum]KJR65448.1 hypothetical protein VY88_04540 [Azospirillum thiophilum]